MHDIYFNIDRLINYAINKQFIHKTDALYCRNRLCDFLQITPTKLAITIDEVPVNIGDLLAEFTAWGYQNNRLESTQSPYCELFETALMGLLVPMPSVVCQRFWAHYNNSPKEATDYYYQFSKDTDYIKVNNVAKNIEWTQGSAYGTMEMAINLSKPEKDPKAIAAALNEPETDYPPCVLCKQNVGFSGTLKRAPRQTHRVIDFKLAGEDWFMQYSPYVYYNEHAIVIKQEHTPMFVSDQTFIRLFDFLDLFPHYFIGSNAGLPIVGGSLLTHDHYQAGCYQMPLERAGVFASFDVFNDIVQMDWLNWPMTVLRLTSHDRHALTKACTSLVDAWYNFTDETIGVLARTSAPHNAITPIARRVDERYQIDIVLRNNRTDDLYPDGIFHSHKDVHPVKKENIGLIEVLGHAILPGRLIGVIEGLKNALNDQLKPTELPDELADFKQIYQTILDKNVQNIDADIVIKQTIGEVFIKGLTDAAVIRQDDQGKHAMTELISQLKS